MMKMEAAIRAAVRNVARYGDTDIFPFPFENLVFSDRLDDSSAAVLAIHDDFDSWFSSYPPQTVLALSQVGYAGFRWAALIDPFWNAYYLALVIGIAEQIEAQRIQESEQVVFSYRYSWQDAEAKLFKDSTWFNFRQKCIELSESYPFIVQTDISDFYPRIYHHRVENALNRLPAVGNVPKRIMNLLSAFSLSKNVSYGLPIGGPASRILSELALDGVDKLLVRNRTKFCRYADDFTFFCADRADAYRTLVFLSEKLANEGLVLQKKKTRILTADEFRQTVTLLDPAAITDHLATDEQRLLSISLRFDPYSPHAAEDYRQLKEAVSRVDIVGILGREIAKPSIDSTVAKQAVQAIMALDPPQQEQATATLLSNENLMTLAPVFTTVMRVLRDMYNQCSLEFQAKMDALLCDLWTQRSPLLSVEVNLAYYIQALAGNRSQRKEEILIELFSNNSNPVIRRLVILAMTKWNCSYWLSDVKNKYGMMSILERRAFILASYYLGDEGKHWRDHTKTTWSSPELLIRDWFSVRFQTNKTVPL